MLRRPDNERRRQDGTLTVIRPGAPPDDEPQEIRSLDPRLDLTLFASEGSEAGVKPPLAPPPRSALRPRGPALPVLALTAAVAMSAVWWVGPEVFGLGMGRVRIESVPPGAPVIIDGVSYGVTPLLIPLKVGAHVVDVGDDETGRDRFEMRVEGGPQTYRVQLPVVNPDEPVPGPAGVRTP
jgi:hypothetical protein